MAKEKRINGKKCIYVACPHCRTERWVQLGAYKKQEVQGRCVPCSIKFRKTPEYHTGTNNPQWKGGRHNAGNGYVRVRLYPHDFFYPMAMGNGYALEHRLVVAKALGRCLYSWEVVHHKKGFTRDDNRYPETLQLMSSEKHIGITILENKIIRLEKQALEQAQRITLLEAENILFKKEQIYERQHIF